MRQGLRYPDTDPRVVACKKAIGLAGGLTRVGRMFGVTPQAIYKWEIVPAHRCQRLEMETGVSIHEMRPDVFGVRPGRVVRSNLPSVMPGSHPA